MRIILGWLASAWGWYWNHWLHATGWRKPKSLWSFFVIVFMNHCIALLAALLVFAYLMVFREFLE